MMNRILIRYSYLVKGLCEKGRVGQGLRFFKEMREKGLVPIILLSWYWYVACPWRGGLMMRLRFVFDMLGHSKSPDLLTYRTLLEEMCRDGRGKDALELLEELRKKDSLMGERTYKTLLNGLHFFDQE
ncbi:hypothetical protein Ancab_019937 [Ancistrocladus abbreviatus]